jgi:hypothetical protein
MWRANQKRDPLGRETLEYGDRHIE